MDARRLFLDAITLKSASPPALIRIAAEHGFAGVSLWVNAPTDTITIPVLRQGTPMLTETKTALSAAGLSVHAAECFDVTAQRDSDRDRRALEVAATLGARIATALFFASLSEEQATERLGEFADLAAEYDITASVEFMSGALTGSVNSLAAALRVIDATRRRNVGLTMDMLHLFRTGAAPEAVARVPKDRVAYVQLCDAPRDMPADRQTWEAGSHRLYPGEGVIPLRRYLASLPAGVPVGLEIPREGESAADVARKSMASVSLFFPR